MSEKLCLLLIFDNLVVSKCKLPNRINKRIGNRLLFHSQSCARDLKHYSCKIHRRQELRKNNRSLFAIITGKLVRWPSCNTLIILTISPSAELNTR